MVSRIADGLPTHRPQVGGRYTWDEPNSNWFASHVNNSAPGLSWISAWHLVV